MKFKGIKLWVAFCEVLLVLACLPILIMCTIGLLPSLLIINKRETGSFGFMQILRAIITVTSDLKDEFVESVNGLDMIYEE